MTKCAFIPNFLKFYNLLWKGVLPFLKRNPRLSASFSPRVHTRHLKPADLWIQAASAGEAFLAVSLMEQLSPKTPLKVLITATTSQGMEILKAGLSRNQISSRIQYSLEWFPFDIPTTVQKAVKKINPQVMILLETEIWPALLHYLKKNQTQIFIVNARLSEKSGRHYRLTRKFWTRLAPDRILAISPSDAARYARVFATSRITTMSNIKFDTMAAPDCQKEQETPKHQRQEMYKDTPGTMLPDNLPLCILASFRRQEEPETIRLLKRLAEKHPAQVLALFPRHMHRIKAVERQLRSQGIDFRLRSKLTSPLTGPGIILWDHFGDLRSAYGLATTVFVGGSLHPLGGQNFIEPLVQGTPAVTGPHLKDFLWVGENIFPLGLVTRCNDWEEVASAMLFHLKNPVKKEDFRQKARAYFQDRRGGTQTACKEILKALGR